jgi:hypothetical protein
MKEQIRETAKELTQQKPEFSLLCGMGSTEVLKDGTHVLAI